MHTPYHPQHKALLPSRSPKPTLILQAWSATRAGPHSATPTALPTALTLSVLLNWNIASRFHLLPQTCCFTRYMQTLRFRHTKTEHTKTEHAKRVPFRGWREAGSGVHLPPLGVASGPGAQRLPAEGRRASTVHKHFFMMSCKKSVCVVTEGKNFGCDHSAEGKAGGTQ